METVLTAQEVRKELANIVSKAHFNNESTVITRNGKEVVAIVSYEDFKKIQELKDLKRRFFY